VGHSLLWSPTRNDAVVLEALAVADPKSPNVKLLAESFLERRRNCIWGNTQENCWGVVALNAYFRALEKDKPDATTRIWLNNQLVATAHFKDHSLDTQRLTIPMTFVTQSRLEAQVSAAHESTYFLKDSIGDSIAIEPPILSTIIVLTLYRS
jgi:hypothetical protein